MLEATTARALPTLGRRSETILNALRDRMDDGEYEPNSRLPTEKDLCTMFDASRTTVRRAIARLASDGYVEVVQGSGTYVLPRPKAGGLPSCTISVMFPFDSGSLAHVQGLAIDQDYLLSVFCHTDWSPATERKFLQRVLQERHRGLLAFCTPRAPLNEDLLDALDEAGTRVIHVEHYTLDLPLRSFVLPDYRRGGAMAANALMIAGYEHFHYVGLADDGPYAQIAFKGFAEALHEQGCTVPDEQLLVRLPNSFQHNADGQRATSQFITSLPPNTGLVARSTDLAEELQKELVRHGRDVPQEIGLIGIKHLLNYRAGGTVDHVDYDWQTLLRQAVGALVVPNWQGIRSWIKPQLVRQGSARVRPTLM